MVKEQRKPRVGDECWEVEWCTEIPLDKNGDAVLDQCTMKDRLFKTEAAAWKHAKKVYPLDKFGSVAVTRKRFCPYDDADAAAWPTMGFWETVGDPKHYEGEEEEPAQKVRCPICQGPKDKSCPH